MPKNICPDCGSDRCKSFEVLLDEKVDRIRKGYSREYPRLIARLELLPKDHPLITPPKLETSPYMTFKFILIASITFMVSIFTGIIIIEQLHSRNGNGPAYLSILYIALVISMFSFKHLPIGKLKEMKAMDEKIKARNEKLNAEYEEKLSKLWKCSSCGNIYDPN